MRNEEHMEFIRSLKIHRNILYQLRYSPEVDIYQIKEALMESVGTYSPSIVKSRENKIKAVEEIIKYQEKHDVNLVDILENE